MPGLPCRLPMGSMRSTVQAAGSGSLAGHAFPCARTLPPGRFSTRSFIRYQVSGFQANATLATRAVSGCHGEISSFCALPKSTRA